jgi:hypothetical protein
LLFIPFWLFVFVEINATGQWKTYLSYADIQNITQSPNKVFAISSGALYSLDKRDLSLETYSKITGLSDNDISDIAFDNSNELLFIAYANANIDLIATGGIFNIPDLQRKTMTGSKKINGISFNGDFAYLATDFGICKVNVKKREFSDTYMIGDNSTAVSVKAVAVRNDSIFGITDNVLYAAAGNKNLSDYRNWQQINFPETDSKNQNIVFFDNELFLLKENKKVYRRNNGAWEFFTENIENINASQNRLNLTKTDKVSSYAAVSGSPAETTTTVVCRKGVYDTTRKQFFIAVAGYGLVRIDENNNFSSFTPSGPVYNDPYIMKFVNGKLFVTTSGTWVGDNFTGNIAAPGAVMIYDGNSWLNIGEWNIPDENNNRPFVALLNIAIDPNDDTHFFVGSWRTALFEFRNNTFYKHYNSDNSDGAIQALVGDPYFAQPINGLTFDKDGNLWLTQGLSIYNIKVKNKDGTWKTFYFPNFTTKGTVQELLIDSYGLKWVNVPRGNDAGIFVFDDTNESRNVWFTSFIDQDNHSFASYYHCFALDKNDPKKLWIGTNNGAIIVPDTRTVFNTNFTIQRIKIPRNDGTGLADYLLENEIVNFILPDDANRKWLGTRTSGVYLVSENGAETIEHFTAENSPLLSNNVKGIAINPVNGEVFFATDKGIISYMGSATEGKTSFKNVYAYPNPVRENYEGVISIVGLMNNSAVKITDIAGNLVYETISNGGMATWDGTNISGQRVSTGVYLAMCSNPDGSEGGLVKILIINK